MIQKNQTVNDRLSYLSWSKISLWENDPNLFYQVYVEGLDQFRTKHLELGKRLATGLENGFDNERDPIVDMVIRFMPSYPLREYRISVEFDGIPLVGIYDGFNASDEVIGEYKSGKSWTQKKVDDHGQLTFYALLYWLKYKKLPRHIYLHWAKTREDENGNIELTGDIKTFETKRTMKDIILFSKRIKNAWTGICEIGKFVQKYN